MMASAQPIGWFDGQGDVGDVEIPGSSTYDPLSQEYTVVGSGTNMWYGEDEFQFVWKRITGDFIVRAHARFEGEGVNEHRKLGWIARSSLEPDSPYVDAAVHGDGLTSLQYRREKGADTEEVQSTAQAPDVIQLERTGDRYVMSVAKFGEPFLRWELSDIDLGDELYVGLFITAHDSTVSETAVFSNVRIVLPPGPGFVPYQNYLASNLEVLDVDTGRREIVYRHPQSIQAPNWTPDGKSLIFNGDGLLYKFDLFTRVPVPIDTDFAKRNNNDHVLSFDGKMLAISHHPEEHNGQSIVYVVPVEGGIPRKVTNEGPSYLHGWSPDGKWLTYTAQRNGEYDIYKIPTEGGEEVRLTTTPGLDDGSEYSPDGRYIYYNSVRSGTMQLWRMKPDGTGHEQLTDDGLNNWFPHISPDGKRMVFISYLPDVAPSDHPFYKQVYLRMMPADGGEPTVIAYLYGGQGTINVPSWAPDSKRIAFVSNTGLRW
ncbi:MAG TPA: hypothetical protein VMO47_13380 [Rhodothermales bacterium]|nr:hypothetical protein [Rhodothermales bacterium]